MFYNVITHSINVKNVLQGQRPNSAYIHKVLWFKLCYNYPLSPSRQHDRSSLHHFIPHPPCFSGIYACPTYYYPNRTGATGRPSFVVAVDVKSGEKSSDHWAKRGAALLMSLDF